MLSGSFSIDLSYDLQLDTGLERCCLAQVGCLIVDVDRSILGDLSAGVGGNNGCAGVAYRQVAAVLVKLTNLERLLKQAY
jgi:hypothetical protein